MIRIMYYLWLSFIISLAYATPRNTTELKPPHPTDNTSSTTTEHSLNEAPLDQKYRLRFLSVWQKHSAQTVLEANQTLSHLLTHYSESHRKYHNITHITDCLAQLEEAQHDFQILSLSDIEEIEIAIWFHDVIYDPKAKDNEEKSAELFLTLSEGMPSKQQQHIKDMILATRDHVARNKAEELLLDLDLSILGRNAVEFDQYDRAIRVEYEWVPDELYRQGRAKVLSTFLEREKIFKTRYFHDKYEETARKNITRAIQRLKTASKDELRSRY